MRVKVIINEGIVQDVLCDGAESPEIEVVDVNKDYEDYGELSKYQDALYADPSLHSCPYTSAHFGEADGE